MNAKDDHWPSLPPIRTSSYNSRVSCETLNLHPPPAPTSSYALTASDTPSSTSHRPKPISKSADASPFERSPSPSHTFSSCFPNKFTKGQGHDRKRGGAGAFDATGLLRSIFGFSSPMVSFTNGASPSNWQAPSSVTNSPSGRRNTTSPIGSMRSGGATPHSGVLLRSSKGHAAHMFTMMPPDVVGKKKPLGYESDEPTSPEVTCIGKVRRKHCKATWDALVKEKHKDAKKKGKVKKVSGEITPHNSEFFVCGNKCEGRESTVMGKRSGRRQSFEGFPMDFDFPTDFYMHMPRQGDPAKEVLIQGMDEGFPPDFGMHMHMPRQGDLAKEVLIQGMDDEHNSEDAVGSTKGDAQTHRLDCTGCDSPSCPNNSQSGILNTLQKSSSSQGESVVCEHHEGFEASLTESAAPALLYEMPPPSNCLLMMKKGSRNRSAHYEQLAQEPGHANNQWNWGQVLT